MNSIVCYDKWLLNSLCLDQAMLALNTDELSHNFHLEMTALWASCPVVLINISSCYISQIDYTDYTDIFSM